MALEERFRGKVILGNSSQVVITELTALKPVQMGMLVEQLRRANVRLIAVNEGVDTGSDLMMISFRSAM